MLNRAILIIQGEITVIGLKKITLLCLLAAPFAASANAYIGTKVGAMEVRFDDDEVNSSPSSIGVMLGYRFDSVLHGLSAEFELTRGVNSGEVSGLDLDVESQGVYVAYQTSGRLYLKGRLGFMNAALDAGVLSEDEGGETYGVAAGYRFSPFAIELDVTSIDDDVTFLSLGVLYSW